MLRTSGLPVARVPLGSFADSERTMGQRALESDQGNKMHAAQLLGISLKKLFAKIAQHGINRSKRPEILGDQSQ